jgi:hypothetical protein
MYITEIKMIKPTKLGYSVHVASFKTKSEAKKYMLKLGYSYHNHSNKYTKGDLTASVHTTRTSIARAKGFVYTNKLVKHADILESGIKISVGNDKLGFIPNFNLPPIKSCLNHSTCATFKDSTGKNKRCYALKSYEMYTDTRANYDHNYDLCLTDLELVKKELIEYCRYNKPKYFRIHSSGDFYSKEYLEMWLAVIKACPKTKFLAYTKVYGFFHKLELPKNFSVFLSYMPSIPYDQAKKFSDGIGLPMAYAHSVKPKKQGIVRCLEQVNTKLNCNSCGICFEMPNYKRPFDILFIEH